LPDKYEEEDLEMAVKDMTREISKIIKNDYKAGVMVDTLIRYLGPIPSDVNSGFSTYLLKLRNDFQPQN